ncbi:MAG: NUDIX hydrolase [Hyphomicrobiales bacterium]|nr:NUDIX hydrolase [Hyphomicrobiales bacterium]
MTDSSENPADPLPRPAVSAAIFRDGKVLLGQRSKPPLQGVWSLPGGHIEAGEEALAAVTRELLEETGVTADILGQAEISDVIVKGDDGSVRARYEITVFFGIWASGEPRAGSDCQAVRWADRHALDGLELTDGTAATIARAQRLISQRKN